MFNNIKYFYVLFLLSIKKNVNKLFLSSLKKSKYLIFIIQ